MTAATDRRWRAPTLRSLSWRVPLFFFGVCCSTFCYTLTIKAALGLGPLFAFQTGIHGHTGLSIGGAVTVVGVGCILVALCLRTLPGPGTVIYPFFSGWFLDWVLPHTPVPHGWLVRLAVVVAATVAMALGGACTFRAALGVSAYDSVMLGLHRVTHRSLAPLRLGMEFTMLVTGWLLGGAIGIGTVITGLLIGPSMQFWIRRLGGVPSSALERVPARGRRGNPPRTGARARVARRAGHRGGGDLRCSR